MTTTDEQDVSEVFTICIQPGGNTKPGGIPMLQQDPERQAMVIPHSLLANCYRILDKNASLLVEGLSKPSEPQGREFAKS